MSGKKPILTMAQGIPRIHAVPNEVSNKLQFFVY